MYFLSEEERKMLYRRLLPKSREQGVADELRGWNWYRPPLEPIFERVLALFEVAHRYCPTARDVYLRHVVGVKARPNFAMIQGSVIHSVLQKVLTRSKRLIYEKGVNNIDDIFLELQQVDSSVLDSWKDSLSVEEQEELGKRVRLVWAYEFSRIMARIQEILAKQPYISEDALATLAVPITMEQKLDGSFLGLSKHLSTDAIFFAETMIMDLKVGPPLPFYRQATTGYAMVLEAIHEFPVNVGCLVYLRFREDGRIQVKKDLHIINDELRQHFIEERDEKMRLVEEEFDPGMPTECWENCAFHYYCYGEDL